MTEPTDVEPTASAPVAGARVLRAKGRRRRGALVALYRITLLIVIVGSWQLAASTVISPEWISKPSLVAQRLWQLARSGELGSHTAATTLEVVLGVAAGTAGGLLVGLALGLNRVAATIFYPFVVVAYSFPQLAIAPLYIVWFGFYTTPKVVLVGVISFFLIFFNVFAGLREVDRDLLDTLRIMGAKRRHLLRMVIAPSLLAFVSIGLTSAIPFGLRAAVFGELLASVEGLGFLIRRSAEVLDTTGMIAGLVALAVVGLLLNALVQAQERLVMRGRHARET